MKEEIAKEWVKRLRSAYYVQITGRLGIGDYQRCCLGVLSDIAVENKVVQRVQDSDDNLSYMALGTSSHYTSSDFGLIRPIIEWVSVDTSQDYEDVEVPFSNRDNAAMSLASLNDSGLTFDQIADIIECFWREL